MLFVAGGLNFDCLFWKVIYLKFSYGKLWQCREVNLEL